MRRVSISYGFSKLWCVCFFLRSFAICLFVCFSSCVLKNVVKERKEGRKAPPPPPVQPHTKKPPLVKKRWYSSSSVALARSAASSARGRSDFLGRLAHGGVRGVRPGTRRPRTHGGTTRLFVALSSSSFCFETTHHPSIDRSIDRSTVVVSRYWTPRACGRDHSIRARHEERKRGVVARVARTLSIILTFSSSFIIHHHHHHHHHR